MTATLTANLVGITGIARRLVQDGALDEVAARAAMEHASLAKIPLPQWFAEKKTRDGVSAGRCKCSRVRHAVDGRIGVRC